MRLLCAISHHGLGHLAQTAPLLQAMHAQRPDIEWLIWSGLTRAQLAARIELPFTHRHAAADIGLTMHDALRVDVPASAAALAAFHAEWPERVAHEADTLRAQGIAGVIGNAAYLPLAAGQQAGRVTLGCSSLNWWDVYRHYLGHLDALAPHLEAIRTAYAQTRAFIRLCPGMPMTWLAQAEPGGPVVQAGRNRRAELRLRLGLPDQVRLVLVGLGGVGYQARADLPELADVIWLVPPGWRAGAASRQVRTFDATLPFLDWLASSDALVTKVGYGSFVEAARAGIPTLYLSRPDWPETPWLTPWLERHTRARAIDEATLFTPAIAHHLAELWRAPAPPRPAFADAARLAERLLAWFD